MSLGARLREQREKRRWSQVSVARKVGITNAVLSNYERDYRDPDTDTLKKLADLYEVSLDYLLGRSTHPDLSAEEEKEVDKEVDELWEIIESLPDEEREETIKQVLEYAKFLTHSKKTRD